MSRRHRAVNIRHLLMALALVLGLIGVPAITAIGTASPAYASTTLCSGNSYSTCTSVGYTDHGYSANSATSYWGADTGHNCTNYVAYVESTVNGAPTPSYQLGNAMDWGTTAANHGVSVDSTPGHGSVAWWNQADGEADGMGSDGHVAYVESVSGSAGSYTITISEDAYPSGPFDWMKISQGDSRWPTSFIHFKDLPSVDYSGNFATSWGTGRLDIFTAKDYSGPNVAHLYYDGNWQPWDSLGPLTKQVASWPAAVSWGVGRIDLFARGTSNDLLHAYYDANGWHDWTSLGGCIKGAPGASTWGTDRLDVFAEGCSSNNLEHIWYNGAWQPWETLSLAGATLDGSPAAVSWGVGRIDVFARANNGTLIQTYDDASGWHPWANFGGCITGAPSVSSWGVNRLDVFAQGCPANGSVNHIWFDGSWHPWETLPYATSITTSFGAVSWGVGRIDVFGLAPNGDLMQQYDDASGWHPWADLGQP